MKGIIMMAIPDTRIVDEGPWRSHGSRSFLFIKDNELPYPLGIGRRKREKV